MTYKLGYRPSARPTLFRLRRYLTDLPVPPDTFGHYLQIDQWGVLGNDRYGCCVLAGAAHEHMLWTVEGEAVDAEFAETGVLAAYTAVTGFDPADPSTDQGTDMEAAARWRRKIGITDTQGVAHQIEAYLAIDAADVATAAWLFGAVGVGVMFPDSWMAAFEHGQPWDVTDEQPAGGHYVPVVGRAPNGNLVCVTWGRTQEITPAALEKFLMEALVYLSPERMIEGRTPEGFDLATLKSDLAKL